MLVCSNLIYSLIFTLIESRKLAMLVWYVFYHFVTAIWKRMKMHILVFLLNINIIICLDIRMHLHFHGIIDFLRHLIDEPSSLRFKICHLVFIYMICK